MRSCHRSARLICNVRQTTTRTMWKPAAGFSARELNRIAAITRENERSLLKAWHEYFNRDDGTGDGQKGQSH
jgi:hypothetical protein